MRKKYSIWCAAAVVILLSFSGCAALYAKFIEGTWKVDAYYKNGEDQTSDFYVAFADYTITFYSNGDFTEEYKALNLIPVTVTGS